MWADRYATVTAYNGFDQALTVTIDGDSNLVGAHSHWTVDTRADDAVLTAALVGQPAFESHTVDLSDKGRGYVLYNVGERALLYKDFVVYGRGDVPEGVRVTDAVTHWRGVDYWFVEPPESKEISGSRVLNSVMQEAVVDEAASVVSAWLLSDGDRDSAVQYARSALRDGRDGMALIGIAALEVAHGDAANAWCSDLIAEQPERLHRHRYCQDLRGRDLQVVAEYERLLEEHPDGAMYHYLLGRVLPDEAASRELYEQAIGLDPDFAYAYVARGYDELVHYGDAERALADYEQAVAVDPSVGEAVQSVRLIAMQAAGADTEALVSVADSVDSSLYGCGEMYRLREDPTRRDALVERLREDLVGVEPDIVANYLTTPMLVSGDLDGLREQNAAGAGLELFVALSDGATTAERAWDAPTGNNNARWSVLALAHQVREGRHVEQHMQWVEASSPGVHMLLTGERPSEETVKGVLAELSPQVHGAVWFGLYRIFGGRRFAELAKERSLPDYLPIFGLPPV